MSKRRTLTVDEHQAIGAELRAVRRVLMGIQTRLPYPKADRSNRQAEKALRAIDAMRCVLDSHFAGEWPDEFRPQVYYGGAVCEAAQ